MNTNVYCYTYQAPNTINRNNLTKRIANVKYQSIFNIENTDDIMLNLMGDEAGWTKYGVLKRLSVGDDKKTKDAWQKITNKTYKGSTRFLEILFDGILDFVKGMVSGFARTNELWVYDLDTNEVTRVVLAEEFEHLTPEIAEQARALAKEQEIKSANNIAKKGKETQKQTKDATADLEVVKSDDLWTIKQDLIMTKNRPNYITMSEALETMAKWYCENVYTYDPYSLKDFDRNGNTYTFSGRFQYDYDRASTEAKNKRKAKVDPYNAAHPDAAYRIENFTGTDSYKLDLETFVGNKGDHGLYECELLDSSWYSKYKRVGDDCSSMTLAVMYYATRGIMDEYSDINIYELGGGALVDAKEGKPLYDALNKIGFKKIAVENGTFDELESGDLLVSNNHYEFYYEDDTGNHKSFGWGSVKSYFPNNTCSIVENPGKKCFKDRWNNKREYKYIYRLVKESSNEN